MWPGPRPTSVPSGFLIHPTVWQQDTNITDKTDRQTTVRQHRANRFVNGRPTSQRTAATTSFQSPLYNRPHTVTFQTSKFIPCFTLRSDLTVINAHVVARLVNNPQHNTHRVVYPAIRSSFYRRLIRRIHRRDAAITGNTLSNSKARLESFFLLRPKCNRTSHLKLLLI